MGVNDKTVLLGAGKAGKEIARTLAISGTVSEVIIVGKNVYESKMAADEVRQSTPFCAPVAVTGGDAAAAAGARVVVAAGNEDLLAVLPSVVKSAGNAVYIVACEPVDMLTYCMVKNLGLCARQVIGIGTMLHTELLRPRIAQYVEREPESILAYVFGSCEGGLVIPWSLIEVGGMPIKEYLQMSAMQIQDWDMDMADLRECVRRGFADNSPASYIYALALAVRKVIACCIGGGEQILTVSALVHDRYGVMDSCLSLPFVIGASGIAGEVSPVLEQSEEEQLQSAARYLRAHIASGMGYRLVIAS